MKKVLLLIAVYCGVTAFAGEDIVAFWDFEKGLDSGKIRMNFRGSAAIVDDAEQGKVLAPAKIRSSQPGGIILAGAVNESLQVQQAFELSMKLKYSLPADSPQNTEFSYLWDSKYNKNGGMTVILRRSNQNKLLLSAALDCGGKTETVIGGVPAVLGNGKWHTLTVALSGDGILTMGLDGKIFKREKVSFPPAAASQRLTIGDRVGASYGAFTGLIDDVKLIAR